MLRKSKLLAATAVATAAFAVGAAPASAQNQQGLVNVAIEDVTVQVPVSIAANVCDLNVVAIAELVDEGSECVATADSAASAGASPNGPPARQEGLVNVLVDDVIIQVPVAVAANICDVNVVILGRVLDEGSACEAVAESDAQAGGGGGGATRANAAAFEPVELVPDIGLILLDNDPTTETGIPFVS
jgi:hypothetical protein